MKRIPNKRVCAFLIDTFLVTLITLPFSESMYWIVFTVYFLIRDALIKGRSVGKYIVGIRTVDLEGNPCSFGKSCVRNTLFVIPNIIPIIFLVISSVLSIIPEAGSSLFVIAGILSSFAILSVISVFIWIVEYIVMAYSSEGRRLGDRMAKTKVEDLRPKISDGWFLLFSILLLILWVVILITLGVGTALMGGTQ